MTKKIQYFYIILFNLFLLTKSQNTDITDLISKKTSAISTYLSFLLSNGVYSTSRNSYYYQISYVDKQTGTENNMIFPQIKISDNCINKLKSGHTEKIVVAKVFYKVSNAFNTLAGIDITDVVYYEFFYLNIVSLS